MISAVIKTCTEGKGAVGGTCKTQTLKPRSDEKE